jgi:hypothetical protein
LIPRAISPTIPHYMSEIPEKHIDDQIGVSYSQYSWWCKCPHHHYLSKVLKKEVFEDSVHTCFGTAIHEVLQTYIDTLYNKSASEAEQLNLQQMFRTGFDAEITKTKIVITDDEYTEFVYDGKNILDAFTNTATRIANFPSKKYEVVGIEHEIKFRAYIDLILKDKQTGRYKIYDFKTSSRGWNEYQRGDETKTSQLLLYKAFFAQKHNIPLHLIDIEFFIVKRKLLENVSFPQSRIQKFVPEHNNRLVAGAIIGFTNFIESCFNEDGSYRTDEKLYPKVPGLRKKNCKYCAHKGVNCDAKATIIKDEES